MNIQQYINNINALFITGNSTEHSYRGDLQLLLSSILKDITVTNEPKRIECGAPDYILTRNDIPVGYIEAKDVGVKLGDKIYKEQFDRYKSALSNLIITDYLEFQFFRNDNFVSTVSIGVIESGRIFAKSENFNQFTALIEDFALQVSQTIKSPTSLAQMMASKARLMANVIETALNEDDKTQAEHQHNATDLQGQLHAFKNILIHDINNKSFADIYAQTIAYGLFAARYHDTTLKTFSRQEAATLIPQSNPFLRKLFQYIAGYELDSRLTWLVDELVQIFLATDVTSVMNNFGKSTRQHDPIIHFYETFLAEYDPKLRKSRGVWYTPEPVVSFIVRAVDDILKTHFKLPQGLADSSKAKVVVEAIEPGSRGKLVKRERELHRVQILDPATGTGTFLAQVIRHIYDNEFVNIQGAWSAYVKDHLMPRLNGFELLMTSYAMAHLKLDMLLTETGYKSSDNPERLKIYLTNSLEEHHADTGTLFASWLSAEANEANHIKRDAPVMVVMGNPPYSVSSSNKSDWILKLISDYKKDLKERKINLDDDYIKFIRYGQYFVDKKGEGVLAYITNNSFINGLTHRQMRKNLLESFDEVYILDLHGNSKKKEKAPDGSKDENVFDITQGVSINIFVKTGRKPKNGLGKVFHFDLFGKRQNKYNELGKATLNNLHWNELSPSPPEFYFVPKDFGLESKYKTFIKLNELFTLNSSGIESQKDSVAIQFDAAAIESIKNDFVTKEANYVYAKYAISDGRDWKVSLASEDLKSEKSTLTNILYRPFDLRKTYYSGKSKGFIAYPRHEVMRNFLYGDNLALLTCRQQTSFDFQHIFISKNITERCTVSLQTGEVGYVFPLYVYPEKSDLLKGDGRLPNLDINVINAISNDLALTFTTEKTIQPSTYSPIDLLDYIYAILHSPIYRETYKAFLKIDFPRVPYPKDRKKFWELVSLGKELRELHLLESELLKQLFTKYPQDGNNKVDMPRFENNKVYINDTQFFDEVPKLAWELYIGGYQPVQKWLKDRRGRTLGFEDILHYQKIIKALVETNRLMQEIDKVGVV